MKLLEEISKCEVCKPFLQLGPRPVLSIYEKSKIAIIGQAPGKAVHLSGIPWDDKSGKNLRKWLGISDETFYNPHKIALIPMGFCYPGKGKSGDLPPRKECATLWHDQVFDTMKNLELVILIGTYAQNYYLKETKKRTLTDTVKNYEEYLPKYFVLPHPSPRNNIWMAKNGWFPENILPVLKLRIKEVLG